MMNYPSGLILDNSNNYGIVKTETVFGFVPPNHTFVDENINNTEPVEWVFKPGSFERRSLQGILNYIDIFCSSILKIYIYLHNS